MLNVAAPMHMAKKKSFRSAPRTVSGRCSVRYTVLLLRPGVIVVFGEYRPAEESGKEPSEEVDRGNGHANTEEHACEDSF